MQTFSLDAENQQVSSRIAVDLAKAAYFETAWTPREGNLVAPERRARAGSVPSCVRVGARVVNGGGL